MTFSTTDFANAITDYADSRSWFNDVQIEFDSVSELDPLFCLDAYDKGPVVDNEVAIAERLFKNSHVKFVKGSDVLYEFTYTGGGIGNRFGKHPFLLDPFLKYAWGMLLKNLTPPSVSSSSDGERQE